MKAEPYTNENERIVVGLDIGTTKICAIIASVNEQDQIHILGVGKAPSMGLNRGVVVNIERTVQAIKQAMQQAETASDINVHAVNVGVAGDHIRSFRSKGVVTITGRDREITKQDVDRLLLDCQKIMIPQDHEILHVIPQEFIIDGQDGINDPIGMSGIRMEAEVHIITGMVSATQNIHRCVTRAGYEVADIILEPLASSNAVLEREEKIAGVALVDIGGGTTDVAIFQENTIRHTAVVALAGRKVTDDIKIGLSVLDDQAERLKLEFGRSYNALIDQDHIINVPGIAGRAPKEVSSRVLAQIIQARMEEILEIVGIEIKRSGFANRLSAGVVITGGGSLIRDMCPLASQVLGMDVKIGSPRGLSGGLVSEVESPIYSTGVGLVLHALRPDLITLSTRRSYAEGSDGGGFFRQVRDRMKQWFTEL